MEPRIHYLKFAPEALKAMYDLEKYLATCGLEHKLLHLLKLRASQINGCAFCIDMHSKDAAFLNRCFLKAAFERLKGPPGRHRTRRLPRTSLTFFARLSGENGFCRKATSFSWIPWRISESSMYPDMNKIFIRELCAVSRFASSAPLISGITTSESSMSMRSRFASQRASASFGRRAESTV